MGQLVLIPIQLKHHFFKGTVVLHTALPDTIDEVDVITAGGGTAACVAAPRLAAANPEPPILMFEEGPNSETPIVEHPALSIAHRAPGSETPLFSTRNKSPEVGGRALGTLSGGVLGGGSSVNMMLETHHGKDERNLKGRDGLMHASQGSYPSPRLRDEFIAAAATLGWDEVEDLSDFESVNAVWWAKRFVSTAANTRAPQSRRGQEGRRHRAPADFETGIFAGAGRADVAAHI
ncbi:hypothetical protein GGS23DRAFT_594898 [Durotheca rogersii]|uniref:uncharacterized protein n=1 Tax=Durotheca rogersii TaxID=419775 RepID=UPI00221FE61A|nr:uncharacterized protein GGS23DRAFT_594898 [Durotheca rogersii]KAI5865366.1 hypothetical protein GGS23DRAFT_594898 [Durotheca rogersii]